MGWGISAGGAIQRTGIKVNDGGIGNKCKHLLTFKYMKLTSGSRVGGAALALGSIAAESFRNCAW